MVDRGVRKNNIMSFHSSGPFNLVINKTVSSIQNPDFNCHDCYDKFYAMDS